MTIKASELVKRAQQLADLENSSFISTNENIALLNECYQNLYQKVINNGDKYFLETIEIQGRAENGKTFFELPSDFFQLYSLNEKNSNMPILRKAENTSEYTKKYEIVNNMLVLYGSYGCAVVMRYFKKPIKISIPGETKHTRELPSEILSAEIKDCVDTKIVYKVYKNSTTVNIKVYDIESGLTTTSADFTESSNKKIVQIIALKDKIYLNLFKNNTINILATLPYGEGESVTDTNMTFYIMYNENKEFVDIKYLSSPANDYLSKIDAKGVERLLFSVDDKTVLKNDYYDSCFLWYANYSKALVTRYGNGIITYFEYDLKEDVYKEIKVFDKRLFTFAYNGYITPFFNVYNNDCNVNNLDDDELLYDDLIGYPNYKDFYILRANGDLSSLAEDTKIDYPNNLFIEMIAYNMAMSYKGKQNAPIDTLSVLYQRAEEQFYDTISNDDNEFVRIKNDY